MAPPRMRAPRGRFEKFLGIVKKEFDQPCYYLMEGLFQHGRLSLEQLRARCGQLSEAKDADATLANIKKLVASRFVERCPKSEPSLDSPQEEDEQQKKKRHSSKSYEVFTSFETIEQRVIAASVPLDAVRFSIPVDDETETDEASIGEKRKREFDNSENEDKAVLWRPNFVEFVYRLKLKACVEAVRERLDDQAALVFSALLNASKNADKILNSDKSAPSSLDSIYEEIITNEKGRNMTIDLVRATLLELCSPFGFLTNEDELYSIDFERVIESAQTAEVESIVLKRYGVDAHRMFRFLSKTRSLTETDKISDSTFVEKKEAMRPLFKMWQDGYLLMEKLVAGQQFLLWKVNKSSVLSQVLNEMFHAALNLSLRSKHEKEQVQEGMPMENKNKFRKIQLLLYSSLVRLDDAIMLFHDFK